MVRCRMSAGDDALRAPDNTSGFGDGMLWLLLRRLMTPAVAVDVEGEAAVAAASELNRLLASEVLRFTGGGAMDAVPPPEPSPLPPALALSIRSSLFAAVLPTVAFSSRASTMPPNLDESLDTLASAVTELVDAGFHTGLPAVEKRGMTGEDDAGNECAISASSEQTRSM